MDFLWQNLSEKDKEDVKKQVQGILESFSKKLSQIDQDTKEPIIEREECTREELKNNQGKGDESNFSREKMFKNAPNKSESFIIAERKKW